MSKKYSSNDKDGLLVENFKKFVEEGDFSADEELNEDTGHPENVLAEEEEHPLEKFWYLKNLMDKEEEKKGNEKGADFKDILKKAKNHSDPRVGAVASMYGVSLSSKRPESEADQFEQAMKLWYAGTTFSGGTIEKALEREPLDLSFTGRLAQKHPWFRNMFQKTKFDEIMEYYNEWIEYNEAMARPEVNQKHDNLKPEEKKKWKDFKTDFFQQAAALKARKKEKEAKAKADAEAKRGIRSSVPDGALYYSAPGSAHFHGSARPESYSSTTDTGDKTSTPGFGFEENKKYSSNDKDKLLVENFKKFMEEGDFS